MGIDALQKHAAQFADALNAWRAPRGLQHEQARQTCRVNLRS